MIKRLLLISALGVSNIVAAEPVILRAEYESTFSTSQVADAPGNSRAQWSFERGLNFVVVSSADRNVQERWTRDAGQRVWYTRVFHKQKRAIEYAPIDLDLTGSVSNWDQISHIVAPSALKALHAEVPREGTPANTTIYRGEHDGKQVEVHWLEREHLPALIQKRDLAGVQTTRLLSMQILDKAAALPPPLSFAEYDVVDFADIGDRHHDPFIERMTRFEGIQPHH